jgi:hypothetical protein
MNMYSRVSVVLIVGVLIGCGPSVKFFPMNEPPDYDVPEQIEIYSIAPERPFVEIGVIRVRERGAGSSPEAMMQLLKEQARDVGADAIILGDNFGISGGQQILTTGPITTVDEQIVATAIAWK